MEGLGIRYNKMQFLRIDLGHVSLDFRHVESDFTCAFQAPPFQMSHREAKDENLKRKSEAPQEVRFGAFCL